MVKLVFDFSDNAFKSLEELKRVTEAPNHAEVVRKALDVYYQDIASRQPQPSVETLYAGVIE